MIIFSCLVLAFFIGNIWNINITQSVKISVLDIVVAIGLIGQIGRIGQLKIKKQPLVFFVLTAILSLLFSLKLFPIQQILVGGLYLLRLMSYLVFFALFIPSFKLHQINTLIHVLGISSVITGITQYVFFPDIRPLAYLQWDLHYYRVVGTWLDPGFTALLLVLYLLFLILKPFKNPGLQSVMWVATYAALALTYSRSGYLALIVGSVYLAWKVKGWKFFAAILLLLTVTIAILPRTPDGEGVKLERSNSIWSRIDSWKHAIQIFSYHPILGVGFNNYRYAQNKYGLLNDAKWEVSHAGAGADSSLLFVLATTGVIGLFFYLWYIKNLFHTADILLQTSLLAILAHSFFLNSLFYPAVLAWLGILTARAAIASKSR